MLRADTLAFVLAVRVALMWRGPARGQRALMQGAHIIGTGGRSLGRLGKLLRLSVLWIFRYSLGYYGLGYGYPSYGLLRLSAPVGTMIHITDTTLGDIILTATDTGRP